MPATKTRSKRKSAPSRKPTRKPSRTLTRKPTKSTRRTITPEDLTRLVSASAAQIDPDGERIVFVHKTVGKKNEYVSNLWMVDADGDAAPAIFTSGGKDSSPRWSPDGTQIAFIRKNKDTGPQVHVIGVDGGESEQLTHLPQGSIPHLRWSPDGSRLGVLYREDEADWTTAARKEREKNGRSDPPRVIDDWFYRLDGDGYFNAQRYGLCLIDAESGEHEMVYTKDTLGFLTFDFSPDGRKLAITTNRHRKVLVRAWAGEILILDINSKKLRPVPGLPDGPKDNVVWSPDGRRLAYAGREGKDWTYSVENLELFVCDPVRGETRSLTKKEDYCLMAVPITDSAEVDFCANLKWAPNSRRVYFTIGWHGESHVASVAARGGAIEVHTTGTADYDLGNLSADGKRFALTRATVDRPSEVFVGEMSGAEIEAHPLTTLNKPLLDELQLARVKTHWVRTADGTKVHTWVMLPPGHTTGSRRKYPAVLEIHGGPHAQYGVGFFHEFQVLAARGYAVFYSNPRGSKGYGRDHCAAIRGHWGTADWVDIQAVAEFMQQQPNVNTKRMGIMGGSYGGYMTNWAIGHTRVFAGAITDRCVSNMVSMGGTSDFIDEPDRYFPGNFWDRPEGRWEQSPMRYMGNARTPTLIIHSEGDLRCNIEQSEQVFAALKLLNVPTRFVRYPRSTSHGMSRGGPPDMRLHRLHQILEWWEKYLKRK